MTDKPYYSLDAYCKETFHEKCYKIAIHAGMTCPNRDGTIDTRGCIFCSKGGSGDFASSGNTIEEQIAHGKSLMHGKNIGKSYIAYFQAYTNTYAPINYLETIYTQALLSNDIIGISIATRPDCLSNEIINLIQK